MQTALNLAASYTLQPGAITAAEWEAERERELFS